MGGCALQPQVDATTYTLLLLAWLGLPAGHPGALARCRCVWAAARYAGGLNLAKPVREPETCITGMLVFLAAAFDYERGPARADGGVVARPAARRRRVELRVDPLRLDAWIVPHLDHRP